MSSKYQFKNSDIYIKGTNIPKNKLNIKDEKIIHELESELLQEAYETFHEELNKDTIFDEQYFQNLHKRTFETLYEWAGKYRSFDMAKGESRFCQGEFVQSYSQKLFDELKKDDYLKKYKDYPKDKFAQKLAYFKCELIALHPFCELNGRITRLFVDMIALYNGYDYIDYSKISPKKYIQASIKCVQFADCNLMNEIICQGLNIN